MDTSKLPMDHEIIIPMKPSLQTLLALNSCLSKIAVFRAGQVYHYIVVICIIYSSSYTDMKLCYIHLS